MIKIELFSVDNCSWERQSDLINADKYIYDIIYYEQFVRFVLKTFL